MTLFNLFKIQLSALYSSMFARGKRRKAGKNSSLLKKLLVGVLVVYVLSALGSAFVFIFHGIAVALVPAGLSWLYFANVGITTFGMSIMITVFACQTMLFSAKDNELLLSLPIKPSAIIGARLLVLMVMEYLASILVLLPAAGVYVYVTTPTANFYPMFLVASLFLPLLGLAVSSTIGYFIAMITRTRQSLITIFYVAFVGLYLWGYFSLMNLANSAITSGMAMADAIRRYLPPFYQMGVAIASSNWLELVWFLLWCVVPFVVLLWLLSRSFIAIATATDSTKKAVYREAKVEGKSAFAALLAKEWKRFVKTPIYLLNCGLGFVFSIIFGILLVFRGTEVLAVMFEGAPEIVPSMLLAMGFLASMSNTTAPSLSLEGKSFWVLQSCPITPKQVFDAKLALNLVLGIPVLVFAALCAIFALKLPLDQAVALLILPSCIQIFSAQLGLILNLFFPKLDAPNETAMVKQSASVVLTMFASMAVLFVLGLAFVVVSMPFWLFAVCAFVFLSLLNLAAYQFLKTRGSQMFVRL